MEYEYDSKGNVITETSYGPDGHDQPERYEYTYDSNGRILTKTHYYSPWDDARWVYGYEYDSNGNVIKETSYNMNRGGIAGTWTAYKYDSEGRLTGEFDYMSDNDPLWSTWYTYDSFGNLLEKSKFDEYYHEFPIFAAPNGLFELTCYSYE